MTYPESKDLDDIYGPGAEDTGPEDENEEETEDEDTEDGEEPAEVA
jgi:hypothetical protein